MSLLTYATMYRDAGLSVIGSRSKNLFPGWKEFQNVRPTDAQLSYFFNERKFPFLAIICGAGSGSPEAGSLEVIDVDTKNDTTGTLWQRLWDRIVELYKGNPPFPIVQTPSGGIHIYYRCETIMGNKKLATLEGATKAVIETRGQGGLVLAPPTVGYTFLDDRIPHKIPTISSEERDDILAICIEFNEVTEEPEVIRTKSSSTYKATPWHEYNDSDDWKEVLKDAGWTYTHHNETWEYWRRPGKEEGHSASFNLSSRQFYVFSSSTDFVIQKGYRPFDILKIVKHAGDVRKAIQEAKAAGYGVVYSGAEEEFIGKAVAQFNSGNLIDDIRDMLAFDFEAAFRGQKDVSLDKLLEAAKVRHDDINKGFWVEDDKSGKLTLERAAFSDYIKARGYRFITSKIDSEKKQLIRILPDTNLIRYVPDDILYKDIQESLYETDRSVSIRKLRNLVHGISDSTMNNALRFMERTSITDIKFLIKGGTKKEQWFAFRNGAVKVTDTKEPEIVPYSDLPKDMYLWQYDIKDRDFAVADIETEEEFNKSFVWVFFKRICGITKDIEHLDHQSDLRELHPDKYDRFMALITTVGFLLSTYKSPSEGHWPFFEEETENSSQGGGTGKGLIMTIIGSLRNVVTMDAKTWSPSDSFAFQRVQADTDIMHIEDYEPSKWKISELNNKITSSLDVVYKHQGEFSIPYSLSPKGVVTTNYRTEDEADYQERRQIKVYLVRYFNKKFKPIHEFKKEFMSGENWKEEDQHLSDNVLMYCLQNYLVNGIIQFKPSLVVLRKAIFETYRQEFLDFMDNYVADNIGKWERTKDVLHAFLNDSEVDKKYWKLGRFDKACAFYASKMDLTYVSERNKRSTVGKRDEFYCIFTNKNEEVPFEAKFIKGEFF